jgi:hypothetical protein
MATIVPPSLSAMGEQSRFVSSAFFAAGLPDEFALVLQNSRLRES